MDCEGEFNVIQIWKVTPPCHSRKWTIQDVIVKECTDEIYIIALKLSSWKYVLCRDVVKERWPINDSHLCITVSLGLISQNSLFLLQIHFEGVTGHVEFDDHGFRKNYDLDVYNVGLQIGPEKVQGYIA